jgi:hypothetical protein
MPSGAKIRSSHQSSNRIPDAASTRKAARAAPTLQYRYERPGPNP